MELTVLGSGGNTPIPLPTCGCRVCEEARERGEPYARRGNSLFVHDANVLIDAPEFVWDALNRERIDTVEYVFLSHFHGDHTMGLRALQALGREEPPLSTFVGETPTVVVSQETYDRTIEANEALGVFVETWADVRIIDAGETMALGELEVTHLNAPETPGGDRVISGFLFDDGARVFVSPDENRYFDLDDLPELDLWVKETGYFTETPEGDLLVTEEAERELLAHELTFEESLEQVRRVRPERAILTEIEELYRRSYDDYCRLEREHETLNVEFAYDGMTIHV